MAIALSEQNELTGKSQLAVDPSGFNSFMRTLSAADHLFAMGYSMGYSMSYGLRWIRKVWLDDCGCAGP